MCGIIAYAGKQQHAAEIILKGLKTLEYRGYDSWGIAVKPISNSKLQVEKHIGKIGDAQTFLPSSSFGIGHTRWATHGGVSDENAHPHTNKDNTIAVVHNGIVENYREMKAMLIKVGYIFLSETDTEVIAHLIDYRMQKGDAFTKAVLTTFKTIRGSNAIVALDVRSQEIVACRNGSPLTLGVGSGELLLASDVTAVLPYTRSVYFMNDGEAVRLANGEVALFDTQTEQEKAYETENVEWTMENAQKGGYPHYMLKEIVEQAHTISKAVHIAHNHTNELLGRITTASKVIFTACGTAYHCALLSTYWFAESGYFAHAIPANEFDAYTELIDEKTVVIALSQSGETADTLLAIKNALSKKAHTFGIINTQSSTLERLVNKTIHIGAGPEISVVSTKAFTAQSAVMYMLAKTIAHRDLDTLASVSRHETIIEQWIQKDILNMLESVAAELINAHDIYVIGKRLQYPIALETALKIKEASYIHAEGFASGELKHGVISLIEKGVPCIVIADEATKTDILSAATEVKSRGGKIIGIAPFAAPEFDMHIQTPELGDLTCLGNAIAGQLLGYYLSVGRGCDPDKPRNLAKSVTVK